RAKGGIDVCEVDARAQRRSGIGGSRGDGGLGRDRASAGRCESDGGKQRTGCFGDHAGGNYHTSIAHAAHYRAGRADFDVLRHFAVTGSWSPFEMAGGVLGMSCATSGHSPKIVLGDSSVSLSATLSPVQSERHDQPIKGMVGESVFHAAQADPIEAQQAICETITRLIRDGQPQISRLEGLFALERQTQPAIDLLLTQYVEGD